MKSINGQNRSMSHSPVNLPAKQALRKNLKPDLKNE